MKRSLTSVRTLFTVFLVLGLICQPFFIPTTNTMAQVEDGPIYETLYQPTINGFESCNYLAGTPEYFDCLGDLLFQECGITNPATSDYETVIRPCLYPDATYCEFDADFGQELCYRLIQEISLEEVAEEITKNQRSSQNVTGFPGSTSPNHSLSELIYRHRNSPLSLSVVPNDKEKDYTIASQYHPDTQAEGEVKQHFSGVGDIGKELSFANEGVYLVAIYHDEQARNCALLLNWKQDDDPDYRCKEGAETFNAVELERAVFTGEPYLTSSRWGINRALAADSSEPLEVSYLVVIVDDDHPETVLEIPEPEVTCCNNVVFLPGIQATYLEKVDTGDQLWLPSSSLSNDLSQLQMNADGQSINEVAVGSAIETAALGQFRGYIDLFNTFDDLESREIINDWQSFNYDWRYSPVEVVSNPITLIDGTTYQMIDRLVEYADESPTGQVSIVTHSNGGLVAKAIMLELESRGISHLVDQIIFTAPPFTGTPKAIGGILHGAEQGLFKGLLTTNKQGRELAINMPSAYGLLPSAKFFADNPNEIGIYFKQSHPLVAELYADYGAKIDDYDEFKSFMTGQEGRVQPATNDLATPYLANQALLNQAEVDHAELDSWEPIDNDLELSVIAGIGFLTTVGMEYRQDLKRNIFNTPYVRPQLLKSLNGDATVVTGSTNLNSDTYYFNQDEYDIDFDTKATHSELFRAEPVNECVARLLQDLGCDSIYLTADIPNVDLGIYYGVAVHSPISLIAINNAGQRAGIDTEGNYYDEIPGSQVEQFAGSTYIYLPSLLGVKFYYDYSNPNELDYNSVNFTVSEIDLDSDSVVYESGAKLVDQDSAGQFVITVNDTDELIVSFSPDEGTTFDELEKEGTELDESSSSGGGGSLSAPTSSGSVLGVSNDDSKVVPGLPVDIKDLQRRIITSSLPLWLKIALIRLLQ